MSANLGKLLILVGWNVNWTEPNLQPNQASNLFFLRSLQNQGLYKSKKKTILNIAPTVLILKNIT